MILTKHCLIVEQSIVHVRHERRQREPRLTVRTGVGAATSNGGVRSWRDVTAILAASL
jgi:hypothetical protein